MEASRRRVALAALASLAVFAVMLTTIRDVDSWRTAADGASGLGMSDQQLDSLTRGLFHEHVLAFEVLGVLLTAAMIGALVIARPLTGRPDAENYVQPTPAQLEESVRQSDVRTHFPEAKP